MGRVNLFYLLTLALLSFGVCAEPTIDAGRQLYLTTGGYGCAVCHGPVAEGAGQVGGNIRGANVADLLTSLETVAPMKPLVTILTEENLISLGKYLQNLSDVGLVKLQFDGSSWQGVVEVKQEHMEFDLVIYNASFSEQVFDLTTLGQGLQTLAALERIALRVSADNLLEKLAAMPISILEPAVSEVGVK